MQQTNPDEVAEKPRDVMRLSRVENAHVRCTVKVQQTAAALYAHVELDGIEVEPGDCVLVHDAPSRIAFGDHIVCRRNATVFRASRWLRLWTRMSACFELPHLFEVGFSSRRKI